MKSHFRFALATAFVLLMVAGFVQAQPRAARGRVYTKADVDRIIKRVEDSTDKFKKEFDKALDRSRLNNTNREDQLNEYAKELEHATDDLRKHFDKTDAWIENKEQVRNCLSLASKINSPCAIGASDRKLKVAGQVYVTT